MATGLLVTITWLDISTTRDEGGYPVEHTRPAMSTQFMTFVDRGPAEKALEAIKESYNESNMQVTGTILKDIVI